MPLADLLGQDAAVATLRRALASGRVHHAYRFEGLAGVGKERAAFALAQALVCVANGGRGEGCGACDACTRAVTFASSPPRVPLHPDIVIVERGLYPAAVIGRSRDENQEISVDQIRTLVTSRLAFAPHEGRARVILVRRAEEMSISAANALLKTLEEPPSATYFVLLTASPGELLDTIRSRTLAVRFAPLGEASLRAILARAGVAPEAQDLAVELAGGSAEVALRAADPEASRDHVEFVDAILRAAASPDLAAAIALGKDKDRALLAGRLAALAAALARTAREKLAGSEAEALRAARRFEAVVRAGRDLERNAAPALVVEAMVLRLRSS